MQKKQFVNKTKIQNQHRARGLSNYGVLSKLNVRKCFRNHVPHLFVAILY